MSLHLSKCHFVGNHMSRLNYVNTYNHFFHIEPYTQYFIRVRAKTDGEFGDYCSEFPAITDVEGESININPFLHDYSC